MNRFLWIVMAVVGLSLMNAAHAQTPAPRSVGLTLTPPTKFEDGSALNCSSGGCTYNVYRGTCGATLAKVVSGATNPTSIPVPSTIPGQCFRATAIAEGAESDQSVEIRYKGKPGAPGITVVITIDIQQ